MIEHIKVNDRGIIKKKFTEDDLISFSELSEDRNPVHLNDEYAKNSRYKKKLIMVYFVQAYFQEYFPHKFQVKVAFISIKN